jgi:hypothetical protein
VILPAGLKAAVDREAWDGGHRGGGRGKSHGT